MRFFCFFIMFSFSHGAFAYCYSAYYGAGKVYQASTETEACRALIAGEGASRKPGSNYGAITSGACYYYDLSGSFRQYGVWTKSGDSSSSCSVSNSCSALKDLSKPWRKKWPNPDAYSPLPSTSSQDGCALDLTSYTCGTSGTTGEFACWGEGKFTGGALEPNNSTALSGCSGSECEPPSPTTSDSSHSCTAPAVNSGTTSYTCITESNSDQFGSSRCAVGTVNGVTALHCTKPDYEPEGWNKKKTEDVTETFNGDGSKSKEVVTTTEVTKCVSGKCTTTTTTTTERTGTDSAGNETSTEVTCEGDKCDVKGDEEDIEDPVFSFTPPQPSDKQGSFDSDLSEWDSKIEESKAELEDSLLKFKNQIPGVSGINLGGAGATLPCFPSLTVLGKIGRAHV